MAERPMYPWLSPPSIRTTLKLPDRSPTLSVGAGGGLAAGPASQQSPSLGSTLSLPLCSERSSSSSRTSSTRGSTSSSSSWSSQWSWNTLLSNPSLTEALLPPEACQLHCLFAHTKGTCIRKHGASKVSTVTPYNFTLFKRYQFIYNVLNAITPTSSCFLLTRNFPICVYKGRLSLNTR
ncbi:uncharacterized protein LOC122266137 [Penaeus japonicus]|uniref:uncharacterized protein LOC122266137 n=1 Tax=Penaeus japonicus TaxID=27405 RepID=UPI001C70B4D1|nr:uncharacterized protein LOC122266137 [Penaeus japonicus]